MSGPAFKSAVVVGSGMMAPGLAAVLALGGVPTTLLSRSEENAERGAARAVELAHGVMERGLAIAGNLSSIRPSTDFEGAAGAADLVIESVYEDLELKRGIFERLGRAAQPTTILASNTSGISITAIASRCRHPERVVTTHFWNPPQLMPLVEIVMGEQTSAATVETVRSFLTSCGKVPVVVKKDRPGQLGNRLQMALLREAVNIVAEGIADVEDVDLAAKAGFGLRLPVYGIFEHQDMVGLDLGFSVIDYVVPDLSNAPRGPELYGKKWKRATLGSRQGRGFTTGRKKMRLRSAPAGISSWRKRFGTGSGVRIDIIRMMRTFWSALVGSLLVFGCCSHLVAQQYYSVPGPDAPKLAKRGSFSVGVRTLDIVHRAQPDILKLDKGTGKAPLTDRTLKVEIWYPATIPAGQEEKTVYTSRLAGSQNLPGSFDFPGKALRDAPPVAGQKFPLVVVSHGYPGSRTLMTYLTENLASKGYVVAAIDHTDSVFGEVRGFESTLLNRSTDQLFTIETLGELSHKADSFLNGLADATNTAIVGYSMGGYGALTSAGAGYSRNGQVGKAIPGGYAEDLMADSPKYQAIHRENIRAIVAIAPWGEQPPYNAWDERGLAGIRIPSLFITGDHDDVAVYDTGIKRAFERAANSERCMLVFQNARHNTGGNPVPTGLTDFRLVQFYDEPVWRKERMTGINQHFITAFLDLYLKKDLSRKPYLRQDVVISNDGKWTAAPNADASAYSTGKDAAGNLFWKGFQRRTALGMEMYCSDAR